MKAECDVDVWLVALDGEGEIALSADEEARAARFYFEEDRARWIRAHSALRLILAERTGDSPRELRFTTGEHGKPALAGGGVEFNLSHSGDWAAIAVASGAPVGIDIERARGNVDMRALLRRLGETNLPEDRDGLYRAWTRREASSKAAGGRLFDRWELDFGIRDLEAPEGYFASVALIGREPRVRRHDNLWA